MVDKFLNMFFLESVYFNLTQAFGNIFHRVRVTTCVCVCIIDLFFLISTMTSLQDKEIISYQSEKKIRGKKTKINNFLINDEHLLLISMNFKLALSAG